MALSVPNICHFKPPGFCHLVTAVYPNVDDDQLGKALHSQNFDYFFFTVFVSIMYCKYLQRDRALPIAGKGFYLLEFAATQAIPHHGLLCFSDSQVRVSQLCLSVAYLSTPVCKSTLKEDCVVELEKKKKKKSLKKHG